MSGHEATSGGLADEVDRALAGVLEPGATVAYVNVPNIGNLGDNAIYTGARAALRRRSARVAYSCEPASYRRALLRRAVGERGTILIHGGANLGDLYSRTKRTNQQVRMRVLRDFPRARIIQLPQTIFFERARAAERVGARLRAHENLTLMVRDRASAERARAMGIEDSVLCPDTAFALGPIARPRGPAQPIVWIAREDAERGGGQPPAGAAIEPRDWPTGAAQRRGELGRAIRADWAFTRAVARRLGTVPVLDPVLASLAARRFLPLAQRRVAVALEMIAAGEVLVSDRFHGHILACLMGIPNVLLDNSYGKNRELYETWTHAYGIARFAQSPAEAYAMALEMSGG